MDLPLRDLSHQFSSLMMWSSSSSPWRERNSFRYPRLTRPIPDNDDDRPLPPAAPPSLSLLCVCGTRLFGSEFNYSSS